jgi:hypothetical protein
MLQRKRIMKRKKVMMKRRKTKRTSTKSSGKISARTSNLE